MKKYFILLWAVAQALCADATNFEQLHRSFKETLPRNIDSAHAMAGKMLALAKKENALKWQAQALLDQGLAFSYMGNMLQAISKTREALGISEKNKDQDMVMQACFDLGIYYMQINNYDRSVDYTQRALKIAGYQGDKRKQSYLQANLGTAYSELGDYERSTAYYQQAQKNNGCGSDRFFCARLYLGMARNYRQTKTYGKPYYVPLMLWKLTNRKEINTAWQTPAK